MDDERFDALIQRFGVASTRRSALWGAVGAAAVSSLALPGPEKAQAGKRKKKKKKCRGADKKTCGGKCVSLRSDPKNCGACGNVCAVGKCFNGVCNCTGGVDCPQPPCLCSSRNEDNFTAACISTFTQIACTRDTDCGLGSICASGNNRCAPACPEQ